MKLIKPFRAIGSLPALMLYRSSKRGMNAFSSGESAVDKPRGRSPSFRPMKWVRNDPCACRGGGGKTQTIVGSCVDFSGS